MQMLPWLHPDSAASRENRKVGRFTAKMDWHVIDHPHGEQAPSAWLGMYGMPTRTLPVEHGRCYTCLGFEFLMPGGARFVYLSDASKLYEKTEKSLRDGAQIDVLVIDCLSNTNYAHPSHFTWRHGTKQTIQQLRPKRAILVGMAHRMDYYDAKFREEMEALGRELGCVIEMGFDGLSFGFNQLDS